MNNNPMNTPEALARLQAAAEYAARPTHFLDGARRTSPVQPTPSSCRLSP